MSPIRRAVGIAGVLGMCLALSACAFNPLGVVGGGSQAPNPAPTGSKTASATVSGTASAAAPAKVVAVKFAPSPTPAPADQLLAAGSWGYHKHIDKDDDYTSALRQNILQAAYDKLASEQKRKLLKVFRDSSKVHALIDRAGGDYSDATYSAVAVSANDDAGYDTPWVTATLRADFPTDGGLKRLECYVYRQKTHKGLDNRPLVSATVVGYVGVDGEIWNPARKRL